MPAEGHSAPISRCGEPRAQGRNAGGQERTHPRIGNSTLLFLTTDRIGRKAGSGTPCCSAPAMSRILDVTDSRWTDKDWWLSPR